MQMLPIILAVLSVTVLAGAVFTWLGYEAGKRRARRSAEELAALNAIGQQLLRAQLDVEALCEMVYQQAGEIVPTSHFQLGLFEGDTYHVKVQVRDGKRLPLAMFPEAEEQEIVGRVRETGQPLLVSDYTVEGRTLPARPGVDADNLPRSALYVPLIAGSTTIGLVAIESYQARRFTEEHLRLLTGLANLAASAIRNAQLYENAGYRAEQLNLIGQVLAQVSAFQPLPDLFRQIVTLIKNTFGYYAVGIFISEGDELRVGASTSDLQAASLPPLGLGQGMVGWAARTGKTALANNVAQDPRYVDLGVLPDTRSEVSLPLMVEGRVLGVLDVQSERMDAFSDEDVALLETLAAQLALAVQQAKTYDAERRLSRRLEALVQVSQAIASILNLDDLLERLVELVGETFGFERVHIFIRIGERLVFRAGIGPRSVRWLIDELSYPVDDPGLIPKVARSGEAVLVSDVTHSEEYRPGAGLEDTRSEMVIPIQMVGRVMGVLDLQSEQPNAFTEDDLVLMRALADSAAVAIRNAALYAAERRRRNLADGLREVSATLASELDLDSVLVEVLRGLHRVVALDSVAILLLDESTDALTIYATTGPDLEGYIGHRMPLDVPAPSDEGALEAAIRNIYTELLGLASDRPLITVPLAVGGTLIGYIVGDQTHPWLQPGGDIESVHAFANQTAIAISNARLYAAQQAEAYVTTALLQVAEAVNAAANPEAALETIARLSALLAGVSRCLILRWHPESGAYYPWAQYGVARTLFSEAASEPIVATQYPLLDLLSVADRPLGAGTGYQLPIPEPLARLLPAPATLCFPLRAKSGHVGLLVVDDPRKASSPRLLGILTGIAHQTATVLETANLQRDAGERERLEQELAVAHTIQASFIPDTPPSEPGWEVAAHWRAARQVGGDFYDFIPLPSGQWGMVVADVADKGTPAALFMAVCRTLLRAAAMSRTSPAATLKRVNELLFSDARSDLFVTLFYAVWDPLTGRVTYASGGHNPALLIQGQSSQIIELHSQGIALGVIEQAELEEHQVTLQPGDTLVAYTDGVTEAMQADYTEWGIKRFKQALLAAPGREADLMLHCVLDEIDEFVGGAPQSDDLTIWLLRRELVDSNLAT